MKDLRRADQKQWNCKTTCATSKRRKFVNIGSDCTARNLVGRSHGVLLLSSTCARHFMNDGSIDDLMDRSFLFWNRTTILSNIIGRAHQFGPRIFIGYALNAVRSWAGDLLIVDTEDLQTTPPSEIRVKRFKSKKWTFQKKMNLFLPRTTGEILQDG